VKAKPGQVAETALGAHGGYLSPYGPCVVALRTSQPTGGVKRDFGPSESGYDQAMAGRVRSVGAIATIHHVEEIPGHTPLALPPGAVTPINVLLRPFAKLAEGNIAISPSSTTVMTVPERLADLETEVRRVLGILPLLPAERRRAPWTGVLAELERLSVQMNAEMLLGLDFDFVPDGELRAALDAGGRG
jgi:hypothetical protein